MQQSAFIRKVVYLVDDYQSLAKKRTELTDTKAAITRLLELVEKGLAELEDPEFRERMVALRFRRDELNTDITDLNRRLNDERPDITREKLKTLSDLLRGQFDSGDHQVRQAYARLLLDEVRVWDGEIHVTGSKRQLAKKASDPTGTTAPEGLSFVRKWRTRQDSNL
ncbi:MAG: hypothetical protein ACK4HW_11950 [Roseinatronobacter sp.]